MNKQLTPIQKNLENELKKILEIEINNLSRIEELGKAFSFENTEVVINKIRKLLLDLSQSDINKIPDKTIQIILPRFNEYKQEIENIRNFNVNNNLANVQTIRSSIIRKADELYFHLFTSLSPIISLLRPQENLKKRKNEINSYFNELKNKISEVDKIEKGFNEKINSILSAAEEASAKIGVSKHQSIFLNESNNHKKASKSWLIMFIISIIITIAFSISILFLIPYKDFANLPTSTIINLSFSKLIIFTMLSYFVYSCNKNYKAHRHGCVLNKHRQNALQTFETFINATKDKQVKDAVLLHAAQTIFSTQKTGYLTNEPEPQSNTTVLEIIKGVMGK